MSLPKREILVWVILAATLLGFRTAEHGGPILGQDSFQYLSVAENLAAGKGIRTSIAHFDQERSHGELPAPMTWFPAGYPALMSPLILLGVDPVWAGFLVSSAAFCALVWIIAWLCSWYGLSATASRLVLFLLVSNSMALTFSAAVLSESAFTALAVGSLALLLVASSEDRNARRGPALTAWALCGLTLGLSCWVRYAGLFFFAGIGLYLALEVLSGRLRNLWGPLLAFSAAGVPIAVLLLRNAYLVGTWKGGNTRAASEPVRYVGKRMVAAIYQLLLGALRLERLGLPELLLAVAGAVYGFFVIRALWHHGKSVAHSRKDRPSALPLLTYLGVYAAAMIYLTFFTMNHVSARYCYTLLPLLLLGIGLLVTVTTPYFGRPRNNRLAFASLFAVVAAYLFLNVRDTVQPRWNRYAFLERRIAGFFDEPTPSGGPLKGWVEANIPAGATIVATDGQPTAYVLRRQTVSLASRDYTGREWDEPQLRELMSRFHADFLVLYLGTSTLPVPDEQRESRFLSALTRGDPSSDWLQLAARNSHIVIFCRIKPPNPSA